MGRTGKPDHPRRIAARDRRAIERAEEKRSAEKENSPKDGKR